MFVTGKKNEKPQDQFDKILHNKRCPIHPKSNHSMFECVIIRKSFQSPLPDAPKKKQNNEDDDDKKDPDGFQKQQNGFNVIFGEIQVSPSVPRSYYSKKPSQLILQFRDP